MNKIKILNEKGDLLKELEGYFVPNVGEYIWLDSSKENADSRRVISRIIDVDESRRRFNVSLIVR